MFKIHNPQQLCAIALQMNKTIHTCVIPILTIPYPISLVHLTRFNSPSAGTSNLPWALAFLNSSGSQSALVNLKLFCSEPELSLPPDFKEATVLTRKTPPPLPLNLNLPQPNIDISSSSSLELWKQQQFAKSSQRLTYLILQFLID